MSRRALGVAVLAAGLLLCVGRPAAAQNLIVDDNNNNSPFNFSNPARLINGTLAVGNDSNGEFNQFGSSSNISITDDLVIGFLNGSSGSYDLSAGSMTVGDDAFIGYGGDGVLSQTGGSVNVLSALSFGFESTGAGVYLLSGGSLTTVDLAVSHEGSGGMFVSGGTATVSNVLIVSNTASGDGNLRVSNGGTLVTASLFGGPGQSEFEIEDGTLRLIAPAVDFGGDLDEFRLGGSPGAGPIFDTNGLDVTINEALITGGTIGLPDGGLTKRGGGILTLTGMNSYTGDTRVEGGQLILDGGSIGVAGQEADLVVRDGGQFRANNGAVVRTQATSIGSASGGRYFLADGTHTNTGDFLVAPDVGSTGRVNLLAGGGGTLTTDRLIIGRNGNGLFEHFGGATVNADTVIIGENAGSSGDYNHGPGKLNANTMIIGKAGTGRWLRGDNSGGFTNGLDLILGQDATGEGTFETIGNSTYGDVVVGDAGKGTFRQLSFREETYTDSVVIGRTGDGHFIHNGGEHFANGGILLAQQAGSSGRYDLDSGSDLYTGSIHGGDGEGKFYADGGSLYPGSDPPEGFATGLTGFYLRDAALRIYGGSPLFNQAIEHSDLPGDDPEDGGLFYFGQGNTVGLELAGQNTYTGNTFIDARSRFTLSGSIGVADMPAPFTGEGDGVRVIMTDGSRLTSSETRFLTARDKNSNRDPFFRQDGGVHHILGNQGLILGGDAGTSLPEHFFDFETTYKLNGGRLITPQVRSDDSQRDSLNRFEFNGGTLELTADQSELFLGIDQLQIRDGGATIDTAGFDVALAATIDHSDITGDAAIDGGLTKLGDGELTLTGNNTYTGLTDVREGALAFAGGNISDTRGVNVESGATFDISSAGPTNFIVKGLTGGGSVVLGNKTLRANLDAGRDDTFTGDIVGNGALDKRGDGVLRLMTSNTYTGGTTIRGGVLAVGTGSALGAGDITLDGGTLRADAGLIVTIAPLQVGMNGGTIDTNGSDNLFAFGNPAVSLSPPGGPFGDLTLTGGGEVRMTANNGFFGNTFVNGGTTVQVEDDTAFGPILNVLSLDNATVQLRDDTTLLTTTFIDDGGATFDVNASQLSVPVSITGPGGVTLVDSSPTGGGRWEVNTGHTYTGDTTILGGTLIANNTTGSATGLGSVVIDGGTLAGDGIIAPASGKSVILNSGTIAPGNSPGTLTLDLDNSTGSFAGLLILSGGSLEFELGTQSDLIRFADNANGTSLRLLGAGTTLDLVLGPGFDYGQTYTLFDNLLDSGSLFTFADITGLDPLYQPMVFHNGDLNTYEISFTEIPEPTTLTLLLLGGGLLVRRRR